MSSFAMNINTSHISTTSISKWKNEAYGTEADLHCLMDLCPGATDTPDVGALLLDGLPLLIYANARCQVSKKSAIIRWTTIFYIFWQPLKRFTFCPT